MVTVLLALTIVAGSCGSQGNTADTTSAAAAATSKPHSSTSTAVIGSVTEKTTSPPTTTVHFVAGSACQPGQIEVTQADPVPADHRTLAPYVISNSSATPCTLTGYVTVRVVDQIGREIGKGETHEPGPETTITLHSNGADYASFELHMKADANGTDCQFSSFISLALPGADLTPPAYGGSLGVNVCDGYLGVTPIVAGSSGQG